MRGSRLGIIAQAVGVVALIAIVYIAFLRPNDSGTPAGIELEGGTTIQGAPYTGGPRGKAPSRKPGKAVKDSPGGSTVSESALPPTDALAADTPTESQYTDAVSRILNELARTRP